jgi:uncharacterized SAM-dependent methyltransferase
MKYYKNTELARIYHVSEKSVRNWVDAARQDKLELLLHNENGKTYVANVPSNLKVIEKLVNNNRKYRNFLTAKTVTPRPEFYKTFTKTQIYDIIRNLEVYRELPRQYNYFDGGADDWDTYTQHIVDDGAPGMLNSTIGLLADSSSYLDKLLANYKHVNVVDVGAGNALPVKDFLAHLLENKKLGRYIALDISAAMLRIAHRNIKEWFGNKVEFEGQELDITRERFTDILALDYLKKDAKKETCTLILLLGGTAGNLRDPDNAFRTIHESMNINDLLIYTDRLMVEGKRPEWFDHTAKPGKLVLPPMHRLVFDLLNIDDSFYDVEMGHDSQLGQRYESVRLKVALTLKFKFGEGERTVDLEKGETILLWRHIQQRSLDIIQQFDRNDFYVSHTSQTSDIEYMLVVARLAANT